MVQSANLGFPRIGLKRELKKATESYWKGELDYLALRKIGAELRARHWQLQRDLGIEIIPSNDFSFYDQLLDFRLPDLKIKCGVFCTICNCATLSFANINKFSRFLAP